MVLLNSFSLFSKVQRYFPSTVYLLVYRYRPYSHCELNPKNIYISWKVQRPFIYFYPICVRTPSISSGHSQPTLSLCSSLIAYDTLSMSYAHAAKLESIADPKRYFLIGGVYVMGSAEKTHLYSRPMILNMPTGTRYKPLWIWSSIESTGPQAQAQQPASEEVPRDPIGCDL